ncbi:putative MFS multidrug transporter [Pseudovirgaria hyperparasitica]|uniref:MFS multidrug transporter n=1 Tax=Pseudovirgaria hyperparasitica TaxID=470096 RepID=A0A6A6WIG2_9PEZI|nr:putative MFS multidrug transporter [Pseudovirgaria hyperparasitica]KAF2761870.1 putative MFS multidrug transporter [Pseudovirgaria hyperparasitica]
MSQILVEYSTSGFNVIIPRAVEDLNIPPAKQTWPAEAFPLAICALLLPMGRLSDMYGGFPFYVAGLVWLTMTAVAAGFARNELMLNLCRVSQGIGAASFLPAGLMLIGSIYRPGPRKNIVFAIYGACAPLGFFLGILSAGLSQEYVNWKLYFWIGGGISASTAVVAWFTIPSDIKERKGMGVRMDWIGFFTIPITVILIVFAITESAHAKKGWLSPHVLGTLAVGIGSTIITTFYEGWIATNPLIPPSVFKVKYMKALMLSLLLEWGALSIYMYYGTFYMTKAMGASSIQIVSWFLPMVVGGAIIALVSGKILDRISGTILLIIASVTFIVAPLLFAIAPPGANYWAFTFPAMICATIGVDTSFTVSNVFISNSVPLKEQGIANAINSALVHLGTALFIGCAEVVAISQRKHGEIWSFKAALWFGFAVAVVSLIITLAFVRIKAATSDLTVEEKMTYESTTELVDHDLPVHDPYAKLDFRILSLNALSDGKRNGMA